MSKLKGFKFVSKYKARGTVDKNKQQTGQEIEDHLKSKKTLIKELNKYRELIGSVSQEVINLETEDNECTNVNPTESDEINILKNINDNINPIKDTLPETNPNTTMNDKSPTRIEDKDYDISEKLPVPYQMDLDDPESLDACKKLQEMSGYNFEAHNMNNTTDKNILTVDTTIMAENQSPIKDTTNKDVTTEKFKDTTNNNVAPENVIETNSLHQDTTNKDEPIKKFNDTTTKDMATENVTEKHILDKEEIHKNIGSDKDEDESDSSEDEEDNTLTCKYHKSTTDIEHFSEIDKRYMKKTLTFYKSYGQHGCRNCKSEFSSTKKGTVAYHCNHEHCYFAICPNCQKKALKDSKINNTENDNKRSSKRRKQNTYPVVYAEGANTFNFW